MRPALLIFACITTASLFARKVDHHGNETENYSARGLRLHLSAEKLRFAKNEVVQFTVSLVNEAQNPITVYLHENPLRNFTFIARDAQGRSLNVKEEMYFRYPEDFRDPHHTRYTGEPYPMRKMILHAGEKYQKQIKLADYVDWETFSHQLKTLNVTAHFYPNPMQAQRYFVTSESSLALLYDQSREVIKENDNAMAAQILTPGVSAREIVYLLLSAEYTKNWAQYFKYVSLKDLVRDYPEFSRVYANDSGNDKASALGEFRKYLSGRGSHKLVKFRVLAGESRERPETAEVRVRARRDVEGFERDYLTTYYLTKRDTIWQVTGVESRLAD